MIGKEEIRAVSKVLQARSLFRYHGPKLLNKVRTFEDTFSKMIGTSYALGVSSGTAAVLTALRAAGVGAGDEVIIPAYTWIATASSVMATQATPVVADVDRSLTLDPSDLEAKITAKTKAVIPVHMRGVSCRMDEIMRIAKKHGLLVVEDCAQSLGASYHGKQIGSIGDIGAFSFQLKKVITAGEGGAVTTNQRPLFERAVMFHDMAALIEEFWGKFQSEPIYGLNFRMTEITGAILLEQLKKLRKILRLVKNAQKSIREGIRSVKEIQLREIPDPEGDIGISLIFFLETANKARELVEFLCENNLTGPGYGTHVVYDPSKMDWHIFAFWKGIVPLKGDECQKTLGLLSRAVHMDVSPLLTRRDINQIVEGIHRGTRLM